MSTATLLSVAAVAAAGAAVAVVALDASPTAWPVADAVERGLFVALCALAGSRARRWTFIWTGAVAVACGSLGARAAGTVVVLGGATLLLLHRRNRIAGAALGAVAGLALLDLRWPETPLATAGLAALAVAPLWITAARNSRRRTRRWIAIGATVAGVLVLVGVAGTVAFGLQQRQAVAAAISRTREAVDAVGDEEPTQVRARFASASASFDAVATDADAWWLMPARAVPALGPNLEQVRVAARSGAHLSKVAADLTSSIDQDRLRRADGGIDLAVMASMQAPVAEATNELRLTERELSDVDSDWLVGPLADRMAEFRSQLGRTRRSAEVAQLAVERAPDLLGAAGPRRYLLLLGNPAELRDIGGHLGNWAEIRADNGVLRLVEVGIPPDLASAQTVHPPTMTPGAYPQSLVEMRPQYYPQNWGATPDLDTVARLSNELYTQLRPGPPLDGVLYADPSAFAALLEITGPVPVPTTGVTLTADNAEDFLTKGQFAALPESSHAIDQVIRSTLNTFTSKKLPAPRVLGRVLAPVVDEGRLQFASLHERDRPLLDRLGLSGSVARHGEDDLLAVVNRNANPSKIDAYLRRDVRYDVRWNPATGQTTARVTVRLTNDLPAGPLPDVVTQAPGGVPPGTNRTQLSVLSPLTVHAAAVDGERAGVGTQQEYAGVLRHSMLVDVPAGATREVTFDLEGPLAIGRYELQWYGQPLVDRGHVRIRIQQVGPELPPGVRPVTRVFPADEDHTVRVVASPV